MGNAVVWGNTVIGYNADGTVIYGDAVDWSTVNPDAVVWGNLANLSKLSPARLVNFFTPVF